MSFPPDFVFGKEAFAVLVFISVLVHQSHQESMLFWHQYVLDFLFWFREIPT